MSINLIIAVVRESQVKAIVSQLYNNSIPGVTISPSKGYGEHINSYSQDITENTARVEVFVAKSATQLVVDIILDTAKTGMEGDGILAVLPVTTMYHVKDSTELSDHQLMPGSNNFK